MHYYQFNIADFNNSTRHLSRLERGIYRDLIDLYYDTEKPLSLDSGKLCRRIIAIESDEKEAVETVINEFFTKSVDGYIKNRIEIEIDKYHSKADSARANGKLGGRPKKPKITQPVNLANPEESERKANQELLTNNHKPITNNQLKDISEFEKVWSDYEKKGNRKTSLSRFNKLKEKDLILIRKHLPKYVLSTPDKKYRKNFETYISKESWNDEIEVTSNENTKQHKFETTSDRYARQTEELNARQQKARYKENGASVQVIG